MKNKNNRKRKKKPFLLLCSACYDVISFDALLFFVLFWEYLFYFYEE